MSGKRPAHAANDWTALPLRVRAPEIAGLVARLPRGEWGADELGTLANWLTEHGYDIGNGTESAAVAAGEAGTA